MSMVAAFQNRSNGGLAPGLDPYKKPAPTAQQRQFDEDRRTIAQSEARTGSGVGLGAAMRRPAIQQFHDSIFGGVRKAMAGYAPMPAMPTLVARDNRREIDDIVSKLGGQHALELAAIQASRDTLARNQGLRNQGFDLQRQGLNANWIYDTAYKDLDLKGANIQLGNMAEWRRLVSEQANLSQSDISSNMRLLDRMEISSAEQWMKDAADVKQARTDLTRTTDAERRKALSAAVVRGVIGGVADDWTDIEHARQSSAQGIDSLEAEATTRHADRRANNTARREQLLNERERTRLSAHEQHTKLNEREQLLQIEADKLNISKAQLQTNLDLALRQLGLDQQISQGQFVEAMANANGQQAAALQRFIQQAASAESFYQKWYEIA